jgi:nucleoside-diphosphate-sugar epimerase
VRRFSSSAASLRDDHKDTSVNIFLAGATGVIGQPLIKLLVAAGHRVTGMSRSQEKASALASQGVAPAIVDVFDADAVKTAVSAARPDILIHQLTDLPDTLDELPAALERNARIRIDGTCHLVDAARAAGVPRIIAQSICFIYAPGDGARVESDPLVRQAEGPYSGTVRGVITLEEQVLDTPGIAGVVLRYGRLYGPGTWTDGPNGAAPLHVDAAAHAALLALERGHGVYNIAEDDGAVSIERARRDLGFDPSFRIG